MDRQSLEDLFRPVGAVTIKRMFGGSGIYADGMMFALDAYNEVYLKTDAENLPLFEAANLRPFVFESKRGTMTTSYRLLPEEAHEDEQVLKHWCKLAIEAARRAAAGKSAKSATSNAKKPAAQKPAVKKTALAKSAAKKARPKSRA